MTTDDGLTPGLYVVATPIGNLSDLSPRAAQVLREANIVFAEDTRVSQTLMQHVGARAKLVSAHAHNESGRVDELLASLSRGEICALVSDAGTPLVSDPGALLVRAAADAGHAVVSIPGPSAVVTALAASGFLAVPFAFFGFIEREHAPRAKQLAALRQFPGTLVLFETKERIADALASLRDVLGATTQALVARELSKKHETLYRGALSELAERFAREDVRGEIVIVIAPRESENTGFEDVDQVTRELRADTTRPTAARAKELALRTGLSRKEAYDRLTK